MPKYGNIYNMDAGETPWGKIGGSVPEGGVSNCTCAGSDDEDAVAACPVHGDVPGKCEGCGGRGTNPDERGENELCSRCGGSGREPGFHRDEYDQSTGDAIAQSFEMLKELAPEGCLCAYGVDNRTGGVMRQAHEDCPVHIDGGTEDQL